MAPSQGAQLALLLLGGFHSMVDEVFAGLDRRGHPGVRPVHEFALRAIEAAPNGLSARTPAVSPSRRRRRRSPR